MKPINNMNLKIPPIIVTILKLTIKYINGILIVEFLNIMNY